jgi:hypothetical protein
MNYQRSASAGKIDIEEQIKAKQLLQNSQYLLKSIKVINPYAQLVELPKEVLKPRRTNAHYLQFIELITYYHQHQRVIKYDEQTGEEYIETTIEDIKNANEFIKEVIIRKSDVLNGATRNYFEKLKETLKADKKVDYTNGWIRNKLRIAKTSQWRYHTLLMDVGMIEKTDNKEQITYQINNKKEYEQLKNHIDNILQNTLQQIELVSKERSVVPTSSKTKVERLNKTKSVT